jgi:hypothetical protein
MTWLHMQVTIAPVVVLCLIVREQRRQARAHKLLTEWRAHLDNLANGTQETK